MVTLLIGKKGTGKTKIMLDSVNEVAKSALGNVVFITEKKSYSANIDLNVRCVYTEDYSVASVAGMVGFIDGLMAGNADIEYIYIDGLLRITKAELKDLESFVSEAEKLTKEYGVKFVLTVSGTKECMPEFLAEYCDR